MCDATAFLYAGASVQSTASILQSQADIQSLEYKAQEAGNNARLAEIDARETEIQGRQSAIRARQAASRVLSEQVTSTVGSGVSVAGGSAQELFESTARTGAADVLQIERNTAKAVWGFQTKAEAFRAQKKQLRKAAFATKVTAPIRAVAPLLAGFGKAEELKERNK